MYATINGWTKERMKAQIRARNTGEQCRGDTICAYENGSNHCAIGCFIPDGHYGMRWEGDITSNLETYPDLWDSMPLHTFGLVALQCVHDHRWWREGDMRDVLCDWIDMNVEDLG